MRQEAGEKRVFLPEFIARMIDLGFEVCIEEGYGSRLGFSKELYLEGALPVKVCSREECFKQDYVMLLRSPKNKDIELMEPGTCLISMLHYPTRPNRVKLLKKHKINSISLDSIIDDQGMRLIENMKAVGWNGLEAAYDVLEQRNGTLLREDGMPWNVLILGTGMVGRYAVDAACKLGNSERYADYIEQNSPCAVATCVGRSITSNPELMKHYFKNADILVDATSRRDTSQPVVPNSWLAWLPEHAVIADLSVDPYTLNAEPRVVRGIEGIPQGNLDKYTFHPDDPDWGNTVPDEIPSTERRSTVSCYSWPGIHPESCMDHYGRQLLPLMEVLAGKGYKGLSMNGNYFERALYRATLKAWQKYSDD